MMVAISSVNSITPSGTYTVGDTIIIRVTFDGPLDPASFSGSQFQLQLETGTIDRKPDPFGASLNDNGDGTGSATFDFKYVVQPGDTSADLDYVAGNFIVIGGPIKDTSGNPVNTALPSPGSPGSLGANANLVIDTGPVVNSVTSSTPNAAYKIGDVISIQVNLSENANVTGTPLLQLETGTNDRVANYVSGSGSSTLTFSYTVQAGDSSADLNYFSTSALTLNGGTIKDFGGRDAFLTLPGLNAADSLASNEAIVVDGVRPTATIVVADTELTNGETSLVTIKFSEAVTGLDKNDFTVANGTLSLVSSGDNGITWTTTFTPFGNIADPTNVITLDQSAVTDAAGNSGVGIVDSNNYAIITANPPVITSNGGGAAAVLSFRENRSEVTTVTANDPDPNDTQAFSITGGVDSTLFKIDPSTGALTFKSAPDFENPADTNGDNVYEVEVTVEDRTGRTDSQTITVTITNANDRPDITSGGGKLKASVDVAENSTAVTKVQASDQDGSSITYAISGGDDKALFSIDATTGKVTFKSAPDFEAPQDKNHDNAYQITIRATDSSGAIDVQYLTINVTDVDGVTITGTEGADKVSANKTVDGQPLPTGEEDHILGLGGNDRLSGLGGDDILEGGEGKDILKGGAGHDHFVYLDVADSSGTGIDRIRDFTQGEDVIDLSAIDGGFHFLGEAGFDGTAGALRQRTSGSDVFLEGDTDGNGVADLVILLKGSAGLVLTEGDLVL